MTNTLIVDGYLSGNLITDGFVAAPNCVRLRTIISKLEQQNIGTYCFEPNVMEPGIDNANTITRRIIQKLETQ